MSGLTTFYLTLQPTNLARKSTKITNNSVNLFAVLTKYYEFTNIFSKAKTEALALYCLYNLQIKLKNREKLPIEIIYSFLTTG